MRSKVAGFEWDQGNWPKCGKHGVSRAEIEYVLSGEPFLDSDSKCNTFTQTGRGCCDGKTIRAPEP